MVPFDEVGAAPSAARETPPRATRREWTGLAVIALPCMLYSMDLTVLNLAVPALARDLRPTASQLLWIIDIYGFMVAGLLMVMGALGDRLGRRRVLLIGGAAFGAASVLAAFAQTAEQLIAARALLGVAGATLAPSTLSLISAMFRDERERTFAISLWVTSFSGGRHRGAGGRRRADRVVLVGLGVPRRRAGDGPAADPRPAAAARAPRPGRGPDRPRLGRALARGGAGRDLRGQGLGRAGLGWRAGSPPSARGSRWAGPSCAASAGSPTQWSISRSCARASCRCRSRSTRSRSSSCSASSSSPRSTSSSWPGSRRSTRASGRCPRRSPSRWPRPSRRGSPPPWGPCG